MSTPAATLEATWPHSVAASLRLVLAQAAVAGYLAGFSLLPNEWLHLGWLLAAGGAALAVPDGQRSWRRHPAGVGAGGWLAAAFLLWMTLRSCGTDVFLFDQASQEVGRGLLGTALLVLFCVLLWPLARAPGSLRVAGWATGLSAALAAALSLGLCYFVLPGHVPGERLRNLLVHGGLNSVCTGLVFGFAAVWLTALAQEVRAGLWRRLAWMVAGLLHVAAFFSGSRGVMLALVCGHAALFAAGGWRRGVRSGTVLLLTGLFYFTSAPLMARIAAWRAGPPEAAAAAAMAAAPPQLTAHWEKALERQDNGRFDIYRAGWNATDNVWAGIGQWGVADIWQCDLQPDPCGLMKHLHSAFFATFVHGGVIGAALLLALLACAARCAWRLARRQGDATWLTLLAFGCGGLLFDGESLTSLATAPRFEGLLFWLPVTVALARGGGGKGGNLRLGEMYAKAAPVGTRTIA